jgi:hypothetical protein
LRLTVAGSAALQQKLNYRTLQLAMSRPSVIRASLDRAFADAKLRPNLVAEVDDCRLAYLMGVEGMWGWSRRGVNAHNTHCPPQ